MAKKEEILAEVADIARSSELRVLVKAVLVGYLGRLEKLKGSETGKQLEVETDIERVSALSRVVSSGLLGLLVRDVNLGREIKGARANFCKPGDVHPDDDTKLRLVDSQGRPRSVNEVVVQMTELAPGSPTHRPDPIKSGHTVSAATTAGKGGFMVDLYDQAVTYNPDMGMVQWQPGVGARVFMQDHGEMYGSPTKRLIAKGQAFDLSVKYASQGNALLGKLKDLFG